ncbi:yrdC domain-containing protein, mitochondrial [Agrilus planipennis]|uniref:Threonylcarbamoyl-AMP synthase n=1 Tax=Agrilus planipennis TaxID=224129 RepID=A0A1W4XEZ8_AGRPL|nr:yrdC domain-containing protein, mitochondrial [Agrilus planipennis]
MFLKQYSLPQLLKTSVNVISIKSYSIHSTVEVNHLKEKMPLKLYVNDPGAVNTAASLLKSGQVIAVPTDTVYGFACSATDSFAIKEIYKLKERNKLQPLAVCLSKITDIKNWAYVQHLSEDLLKLLLPGPVTLLLKLNNNTKLDSSLHMDGKIGVRIPNNAFIRSVVEMTGNPIALTSANISGHPSPVKVTEFKELWGSIACVFDGGTLNNDTNCKDSSSTIVDLSEAGSYKIVRTGIAEDSICSTLNTFNLKMR